MIRLRVMSFPLPKLCRGAEVLSSQTTCAMSQRISARQVSTSEQRGLRALTHSFTPTVGKLHRFLVLSLVQKGTANVTTCPGAGH